MAMATQSGAGPTAPARDDVMQSPWALRGLVFVTDGSTESWPAREAAIDLARRSHAAVQVVTGYTGSMPAFMADESSADPWTVSTRLLDSEVQAMTHAGVAVAGAHMGVLSAARAAHRVAEKVDADLMVVGGHDARTLGFALLGTGAGGVRLPVRRPVLLPRGDRSCWPPATMIVGFDDSPAARRAALVAASLATLYGNVQVLLLDVVHAFDAMEQERLAWQRDMLAASTGAGVVAELGIGDPNQVVLEAARTVSGPVVLALGLRGAGTLRRFVLGSMVSAALHSTGLTLLVVPGIA
jgi:nucleotide-binding universal stress UspA family protein